jgi:hypothetical protein
VKPKVIIRGILGYIPGLLDFLKNRKEKTGSISARYCYSVWLRHLLYLKKSGMENHPLAVGELGPGASLGVGIAALLTGAEKYYALDIIKHSDITHNLKMLDELFELFLNKSDIPDIDEFPKLLPPIDCSLYPADLINPSFITPERKELIKRALLNSNSDQNSNTISINYIAPWTDAINIKKSTLDLILSQAVLEHVNDPDEVFLAMKEWIKNNGYLSHQIDYKAHETHNIWNGHWYYSDFIWKIILKGRSYPINRNPHSFYKALFIKHLLEIKFILENFSYNGIKEIPSNSKKYTKDDMEISGALFIVKKTNF